MKANLLHISKINLNIKESSGLIVEKGEAIATVGAEIEVDQGLYADAMAALDDDKTNQIFDESEGDEYHFDITILPLEEEMFFGTV